MRAENIFPSGHIASRMTTAPTLGIIAGSGRLPLQLIESCRNIKRPFFVLALEGYADLAAIGEAPHAIIRLGAVGEALSCLRHSGASELVLAGSVKRPSFAALRPDITGAKLLARIGKAYLSGDDAVLRCVIHFLEEEGFKIIGINDVLHELITPLGQLGKITPDVCAKSDIAIGLKVANTLGQYDIGQAVVVENGYVLGVEAAEGTDALIERCRILKKEPRGGVLIKACKPHQDKRADLPAIGIATVEKIAQAGFAGIAIHAGASITLDRGKMIEKADALGIFVVGVSND